MRRRHMGTVYIGVYYYGVYYYGPASLQSNIAIKSNPRGWAPWVANCWIVLQQNINWIYGRGRSPSRHIGHKRLRSDITCTCLCIDDWNFESTTLTSRFMICNHTGGIDPTVDDYPCILLHAYTISYIPCLRVALAEVDWDRSEGDTEAVEGDFSSATLKQGMWRFYHPIFINQMFPSNILHVLIDQSCGCLLLFRFSCLFSEGDTRSCVNLWLITGGHRILCHPLAYYRETPRCLS